MFFLSFFKIGNCRPKHRKVLTLSGMKMSSQSLREPLRGGATCMALNVFIFSFWTRIFIFFAHMKTWNELDDNNALANFSLIFVLTSSREFLTQVRPVGHFCISFLNDSLKALTIASLKHPCLEPRRKKFNWFLIPKVEKKMWSLDYSLLLFMFWVQKDKKRGILSFRLHWKEHVEKDKGGCKLRKPKLSIDNFVKKKKQVKQN